MGDEYQLRRDIDNIYDGLYDSQRNEFNVITRQEYDESMDNYYTQSEIDIRFEDFVNIVYPIGSIYMSVNKVSPAELFGGVWEQIEGRFLLGASGDYPLGDTGGEATHTLTVGEMPNHNHSLNLSLSTGSGSNSAYQQSANRAVTTSKKTGNTGGGEAHNNMPPYIVINIWKRTE